MKKYALLLLSFLLIFSMAACGSDNESSDDTNNNKEETTTNNQTEEETIEEVEPIEPTTDSVCAGCNMKIYLKDEEMGQFTAQAVTEDGEHLFFDDSGCLLNAPRKSGETYAQTWVRDYYTLEWINADDAFAVHSDITTPMKMGNAFFSTEEEAEQFIAENADLNPATVTWEEIDAVAYERYLKKQQSETPTDEEDSTSEGNMNM
ncbi:MAG: nitrous oxide reductase accessory protein NosL [Bacillus sp. (in: firmicutes)]